MTTTTPDAALAGFARALRAAGVPVTADRTATFLAAAATVGVYDRAGVYWAGRATLCSDPEHFAAFDAVFESWFAAQPALGTPRGLVRTSPSLMPSLGLDGATGQGESASDEIRAAASDLDLLRQRDLATMTVAQRALLAQLFAQMRPPHPRRVSMRRSASPRGGVDARRTVREFLRRGGEPGRLRYRRRTQRPRPVVLLIDISGSMEPYADALLRLAHVWVRGAAAVEVFTIGTRLTRVTAALSLPDPDRAMRAAAEAVPDYSGGTRLGEMLGAFLDRWGRRGMARRAVVVIFSDGWERGDPSALGEAMAQLRRLAHRVLWVNPHRGKANYRPVQGGIVAALPHCDALLSGHSMATFAEVLRWVETHA